MPSQMAQQNVIVALTERAMELYQAEWTGVEDRCDFEQIIMALWRQAIIAAREIRETWTVYDADGAADLAYAGRKARRASRVTIQQDWVHTDLFGSFRIIFGRYKGADGTFWYADLQTPKFDLLYEASSSADAARRCGLLLEMSEAMRKEVSI